MLFIRAFFLIASLAGIAYLALATWRLIVFARQRRVPRRGFAAGVTILKPLCGSEPRLFEDLSSFCDQDHEPLQVLFGVRDADDPALAVVRDVMARFPSRDIGLVLDPRVRGENFKIANVLNMMEHAKHEIIFVADSDTQVDSTYVRTVLESFADPAVGAVTCLYRGMPLGGPVSALGALFINDQFVPSALVAIALSPMDFCFGATMAVTRAALERIGGFDAIASDLADDRMLGKKVHQDGATVALSSYVVEHDVSERDFAELWAHELRWARTMFSARPAGYLLSFIMYAVPLALIYWAVSRDLLGGAMLSAVAVAARLTMHYVSRAALRIQGSDSWWLIPIRDILGVCLWAGTFFGRGVRWRDRNFAVDAAGRMMSRK